MDEYIAKVNNNNIFAPIRPDVDFLAVLIIDEMYDIYSSVPGDYPVKTLPRMFNRAVDRCINERRRGVSRDWIFHYDPLKKIVTIDMYPTEKGRYLKRKIYHEPPDFNAYNLEENGVEAYYVLDYIW